jgi:hypothetical protein
MFDDNCSATYDDGLTISRPVVWARFVDGRPIGNRLTDTARAFDGAPEPTPRYDLEAGLRELESIYRRLNGQSQASLSDVDAMRAAGKPVGDMKAAAAETANSAESIASKSGDYLGLNSHEKTIQRAYDQARKHARAMVLLLLCLGLSWPLVGQIGQTLPAPIFAGTPTLGSSCALLPPGNTAGVATALIDVSGRIYTCKGTPPATAGTWVIYGVFDSFQGTGSAVAMTGSPVPIFTFSVPPLSAGSCYVLNYGILAGLSAATIQVAVDGTVISQPYSSGFLTTAANVTAAAYCNNSGTQSSQMLVYEYGAPYSADGGADSWVNSPPSVDWSVPHVISINVSQSSGSVTGAYAHVRGSF